MVPDEIQQACSNINEEKACRITYREYQSTEHQKYQGTIGFKITTRSNKVSEEREL